jgi:hypothetical protein
MFGVRSRNEFAIGDTTIAIAGEMPGMGLASPKDERTQAGRVSQMRLAGEAPDREQALPPMRAECFPGGGQ